MLVDRRTLLSRGPSLPRTSPPTADVWLRVHRAAMACRFEVLLSGEDRRHTARRTGKVLEIGYQRNYNTVYQAAQKPETSAR